MTYRIVKRRDYDGWRFYVESQNRRGKWKNAAWFCGHGGGRVELRFREQKEAETWVKNIVEFHSAKDEVVKVVST